MWKLMITKHSPVGSCVHCRPALTGYGLPHVVNTISSFAMPVSSVSHVSSVLAVQGVLSLGWLRITCWMINFSIAYLLAILSDFRSLE